MRKRGIKRTRVCETEKSVEGCKVRKGEHVFQEEILAWAISTRLTKLAKYSTPSYPLVFSTLSLSLFLLQLHTSNQLGTFTAFASQLVFPLLFFSLTSAAYMCKASSSVVCFPSSLLFRLPTDNFHLRSFSKFHVSHFFPLMFFINAFYNNWVFILSYTLLSC